MLLLLLLPLLPLLDARCPALLPLLSLLLASAGSGHAARPRPAVPSALRPGRNADAVARVNTLPLTLR